jgi:hypothetical protein
MTSYCDNVRARMKLIGFKREFQTRNQQAHHDWAKLHHQELQQLRETILSSTMAPRPDQEISTAVVTNPTCFEYSALSTNEFQQKHQKFKSNSKRELNLRLRFQTPKWLFGVTRAIELYECRANAGWNFNIQVYNVVPGDSPVFTMVEVGDIHGIEHLFSTRQASPFDRTQGGLTVLDVRCYYVGQSEHKDLANKVKMAATCHNLGVCQLLKSEGANPNISYTG